MKRKENIRVAGEVTEALPNTMFRVELADDKVVLTTLAGKLRRSFVKIMPGDRVRVEITPYDPDRGRIVFKFRK
jgi:translation initiation factor IF-1